MDQFSYPELRIPELVESLQNIFPELHIVKADIKNPRPDRLIKIYKKMLQELKVNEENLLTAPLQLQQNIENVEMMDDMLPLLTLFNYLRYAFSKISYNDFNMGDLIYPDERRTRLILSAVCNFMCFVKELSPEYHRIKLEEDIKREKCKEWTRKNDILRKKLDRLTKRQNDEEEIRIAKSAKLDELRQIIQSKFEEKVKLSQIYDNIKAENAECQAKLDNLKAACSKEKILNDVLSQKVIQSPERFVSNLKSAKEELEQLEALKKEKNDRQVELKQHSETCKSWSLDANYLVQCVTDLSLDVAKQSKLKADLKVVQNKKSRLAANLKATQSKITEVGWQLKSRQEMKDKVQLQAQARIVSLKATSEDLKKQIKQKVQTKSEDELGVLEMLRKNEEMQQQIETTVKNRDIYIKQKKEQIEQLVQKTKNDSEELSRVLQMDEVRYNALKED